MAAWPAILPRFPQLPTSMGFEDGVLRSNNDVGPAQTRVVTTAMPEPMRFRVVMNRAQLNAFRSFWNTDTKGRALPFTYPYWPMTQSQVDVRFVDLPDLRALGKDLWDVELAVEILPDAS